MGHTIRHAGLWLLTMVLPAAISAAGAAEVTIVEDYSYNPDGALTAVTTTTGDGPPTTTYLTWDNFTPNQDDPATGTVTRGNVCDAKQPGHCASRPGPVR